MGSSLDTGVRKATNSGHIAGRATELASIQQFLQTLSSELVALQIEGEAGIGKTTLWEHGVASAGRSSYRVLSCRPAEPEAHLPYAGLGDLFASVGDDELSTLPGVQRRTLEAALLKTEAEQTPLQQRALSLGVRGVMSAIAAQIPLLVAIDDVQWLDSGSARVLSFALRRLESSPVGLLLSMRSQEDRLDVTLGLGPVLGAERLVRLRLTPLALEAIEDMVHSRLGPGLRPDIIAWVHEIAGGNPLFALELARGLRERAEPLGAGEALAMPESLRRVVRRRFAGLPRAAQDALLVVSSLARPTPGLVEAAVGVRSRAGLDRALEAAVIKIEGGEIRFTHPLVGSLIYADAAGHRRRRLHRVLAQVVSTDEERAGHLALAAAGPDSDVAAALENAARTARSRGAPEAAASLAEQAVRLTPPHLAEDLRRRSVEAGKHHFAAGERARAWELLEGVLTTSGPGPWRARVLELLGLIRAHEAGVRAAEPFVAEALREAQGDRALRARLEGDLAILRFVAGDLPAAVHHAHGALALADEVGNPDTTLEALGHVALFEFFSGMGVRRDLLERAMALEDAGWRKGTVVSALHLLRLPHVPAAVLMWSDDLEAARARFGGAYRHVLEVGGQNTEAYLLYQLCELECRAGNWDLSAGHAAKAWALVESSTHLDLRSFTLFAVGLIEAHRGNVEAAQDCVRKGLAIGEQTRQFALIQLHRSVLGFLALSLGDAAAAHRHLAPVVDALAAAGFHEPGVIRVVPDEVEALLALGEFERAASILDDFEVRARDLDRRWAISAAARCRGLLRVALGDPSGGLEALARARRGHEQLGQPFDLGRTLLAEAACLRRARQRQAARQSATQALEIFERLGARLWSEKARSELRRLGGRPPTPDGQLTTTEERVARLVAAGWTNQAVADSLFVSVKTVEGALTRIYRKLGVSSRRELARLVELGLRDASD